MNQDNEKIFDKVCNALIVVAVLYFVVRLIVSVVFGV